MLTSLYPRFDVNVSKFRNHLLKAPFSIHPATGNICIPIDPESVDWNSAPMWGIEDTLAEVDKASNEEGQQTIGGSWEVTKMADGVRYMQRVTKGVHDDK